MRIIHSPRCLEYNSPGHPESPDRVRTTVALLQQTNLTWLTPLPCGDEDILRVHTPSLLSSVKHGPDFDADTPFFPNIYEIAALAAGAAIHAAHEATAAQPAFSLMRPPGHHATRHRVMGFCYFNNLAIAVAQLLATGKARKVAIVDFDCHHGNGTEDIFYGEKRVLFVSLHQSPCYPGTGLASRDNCLNYPLPPGTGPELFLETLNDALDKVRAFTPDILAISAGFDAYKGDPLTDMQLEVETFHEIGRRLAALHLRRFAVLEGGYSPEFAQCVAAFVSAM